MAFYDWNHDGKKDLADDYIEYQIYKKSTSDNGHVLRGGSVILWVICCVGLSIWFDSIGF